MSVHLGVIGGFILPGVEIDSDGDQEEHENNCANDHRIEAAARGAFDAGLIRSACWFRLRLRGFFSLSFGAHLLAPFEDVGKIFFGFAHGVGQGDLGQIL